MRGVLIKTIGTAVIAAAVVVLVIEKIPFGMTNRAACLAIMIASSRVGFLITRATSWSQELLIIAVFWLGAEAGILGYVVPFWIGSGWDPARILETAHSPTAISLTSAVTAPFAFGISVRWIDRVFVRWFGKDSCL